MKEILIKAGKSRPSNPDAILEITIKDGFITVMCGTRTELRRPVYGYEQHLWDYIQDLLKG